MATPSTPAFVNFIQAQPFVLSGSGSSIGDVALNLQSMVGIDGNNIVTADLGSFAFGTLEPGNGTQEEALIFTGVTQNANGTATLTGVSSIGFKQPYTVTTGLTKTHAGNSKFILSNDAAFYNNFTLYLNAIAGAGAANATAAVKGIVQAATTAQVNAGTATGSTGAVLAVTPDALAASNYNMNASATGKGVTQLATSSQINSATPTGSTGAALTVTPDQLAASYLGLSFKKIGETILVGTAATLSVTSFTPVNELLIMANITGFAGSADGIALQFNADTGANYGYRASLNGANDTASGSQTKVLIGIAGSQQTAPSTFMLHMSNPALYNKVGTWNFMEGDGGSSGSRIDGGFVWNNNTNQVITVSLFGNGGVSLSTGSRLTIYGS